MSKRVMAISSFAIATLIAACGGGTPTTSGARPSVSVPSIAIPSIAIPSISIPSFVIPSFSIPSFAPDPVIEQAFPREIGGNPVTGIQSGSFLAILQAFDPEGDQTTEFVQGMQAINVNPASVAYGTGTVDLDGDTTEIQVIRFPGGAAQTALDVLVSIDQDNPPTLSTENLGGKTVTVATDSDDDVQYYYVNGEWAWFLPDASEEAAATIFAALP